MLRSALNYSKIYVENIPQFKNLAILAINI